ncbi:hypothetical protein IMF27_25580 [Pseudomonas sp. PCH199]|uniref:hypothetical protein n=1 Tax=unclassified Pseudomonas TaxID=196821 RepID=UPI0015ACE63A|nr:MULTISPECIES: hypothetical protein [unclassified Pseudomonas]MCW8278509.1 hypothetical protein [Pseudomonas sp. PCH199]
MPLTSRKSPGRLPINMYGLSKAVAAISDCAKEMPSSSAFLEFYLQSTQTHLQAAIEVWISPNTTNQLCFTDYTLLLEEHAFYNYALDICQVYLIGAIEQDSIIYIELPALRVLK